MSSCLKAERFYGINNVVQPDIVVICNPDIIQEKGAFGCQTGSLKSYHHTPPKKDIQDKFDLYEK